MNDFNNLLWTPCVCLKCCHSFGTLLDYNHAIVTFRYLCFISHTSCTFQIFTMGFEIKIMPLTSFEVLFCMFEKPFRYSCIISHMSRTFQTFTVCSKIEFKFLLSPLECFYACLGSLLSANVLSHTHLAHSKH